MFTLKMKLAAATGALALAAAGSAGAVAGAAEVAGGGEAYPAGVRELARRLVEDCETKGQTMTMLIQRA